MHVRERVCTWRACACRGVSVRVDEYVGVCGCVCVCVCVCVVVGVRVGR